MSIELEKVTKSLDWCISTIMVYEEFQLGLLVLLKNWNERLPDGFRQELSNTLEILMQIQDKK